MKELIFATHNKHKAIEIQAILPVHFRVLTLDQAGITEDIPEDQDTLEGNALQKARYVYKRMSVDCFADDTGLEVSALKGDPGVYSARFAEMTGERMPHEDIPAANIRKLLKLMEGVSNRSARFRTIIALIIGGEEYTFEGIVQGEIIEEMRGEKGFGYDPVFLPEGNDETFAEMSQHEKNKLSHRARAVYRLVEFLKNFGG
ncbi:RdgB/HAM1 family non-canonical purine NTP pyrophosphatase [Bacteroidota bacterium]